MVIIRTWLALAVLCAGTARGAGPSYSAAGIVKISSYAAGPFAPNSVVVLFGTGLARSGQAATLTGGSVPLELNYVRVLVQDQPVPLLYVSDTQINFLMPTTEDPGPVTVRVAMEGGTGQNTSGPYVTVTLVDAAPELFSIGAGYVTAQDAAGKLLTADAPAHMGDAVVVYATGLGQTSPNEAPGKIPVYADRILPATLSTLKVTLNGIAVDPKLIIYAGVTPGSAGLYQINFYVPEGTGIDPEIGVTAGNQAAQTGLKLPVR